MTTFKKFLMGESPQYETFNLPALSIDSNLKYFREYDPSEITFYCKIEEKSYFKLNGENVYLGFVDELKTSSYVLILVPFKSAKLTKISMMKCAYSRSILESRNFVLPLYEYLVKDGINLVSGSPLYGGSFVIWKKLLETKKFNVFILDELNVIKPKVDKNIDLEKLKGFIFATSSGGRSELVAKMHILLTQLDEI